MLRAHLGRTPLLVFADALSVIAVDSTVIIMLRYHEQTVHELGTALAIFTRSVYAEAAYTDAHHAPVGMAKAFAAAEKVTAKNRALKIVIISPLLPRTARTANTTHLRLL